ncbi:MAG: helix-turn-helix transcriptional regulator [Streptosporangiales bacterium]
MLEDVHWADPATLACLARLARTVGQLPLLLIATVRPSPRPPELARLLGTLVDRGASSTTLGPLAQDAVSELTEAAAGVAPGPNLVRQLHRASGNPLLVLEMLAALERAGATETTDRCIEIDSTSALPAIPSLTILHRLSFLSRDTLDLLGMASVMGSSFSVADLSLVSGRPAAGLAGPLREALAAGALADHGDRVGFRHELIREALYRDLPGSLREALHRDLARALAAAGYPPGRVAEHLVRGARPGDAEAVAWLRRAAQEAGARAPTVAVDLLEHALELATPDTRAYGRVAADHAIALTFAGYAEKGETALRTVLARHDDPERDGLLRRLLLQSILFTGRAADALADADEALRQPGVSAADRAHYLTFASFARLNLGELEPAVKLADEAIALAEPTGDSAAVSVALHNKAVVRDLQGRLVEYADLAVLAVHALEAEPDPRGPQHPHASAGLALMCTDRVAEGREMMQRGRHLNERLGAPTGLAVHHTALAEGLFLVGEWDDALSEIEAADNLVSDNPVWPVAGFGIRALVALHRDDLLAAKAHLAATDAALARGEAPRRLDRLALARAMLAEAQGRPEAALPALNEYWQGMRMAGICQGDLELGPELVRRLAGAGQHEDAANVAAAVEETAAHSPGVPSVCAAAQHCRGLVTSDTEVLLAAVAGYRAGARPLSRALACEDAAAALVTADRIAEARELLREALTLQEALRANRGAARTAAALRALGVRRGTRTSRTRPEEGWEALTPTEHKVVALLAQRLSNPEIAERMYLSRRTVETHVSHVLAKLGLRSRLELAAEAERRDATRTVRLS